MNYTKYLIAIFGVTSQDIKTTMIIANIFLWGCYFLGMWWYKSKLVLAEAEVNNQFDFFEREVRTYMKKGKV